MTLVVTNGYIFQKTYENIEFIIISFNIYLFKQSVFNYKNNNKNQLVIKKK